MPRHFQRTDDVTMGNGVLEAYFGIPLNYGGISHKLLRVDCWAILPPNSSQKIFGCVQVPNLSSPTKDSGSAAFEMKLLGNFAALPGSGIFTGAGDYFVGSQTFELRVVSPQAGGTNPVPAHRVTFRRSAGAGTAIIRVCITGYEE
jgi:hypothetical protein